MKHFKKLITCLTLLMLVTTLSFPAISTAKLYTPVTPKTAAEPRAHSYVWLYQIIDGVLYKRLFNETTGEWATPEWEPVV